jgi:CheY-like chemotaxis protein
MAKKILLVDDSATSRLANRMLFSGHKNYELISACDGKDGVEAARRERPDLILMDIEMPRMSGLEACRILKQDEKTKKIPIVLLTMRGETEWVEQGYANGCNDFLTKPVNEKQLSAVLKAQLGE